MKFRRAFPDPNWQSTYINARDLASDNFSNFYTSAVVGPCAPDKTDRHKLFYWEGRNGSTRTPARGTLYWTFYAAGEDDRKEDALRISDALLSPRDLKRREKNRLKYARKR